MIQCDILAMPRLDPFDEEGSEMVDMAWQSTHESRRPFSRFQLNVITLLEVGAERLLLKTALSKAFSHTGKYCSDLSQPCCGYCWFK